jgi:hypothetical protein
LLLRSAQFLVSRREERYPFAKIGTDPVAFAVLALESTVPLDQQQVLEARAFAAITQSVPSSELRDVMRAADGSWRQGVRHAVRIAAGDGVWDPVGGDAMLAVTAGLTELLCDRDNPWPPDRARDVIRRQLNSYREGC